MFAIIAKEVWSIDDTGSVEELLKRGPETMVSVRKPDERIPHIRTIRSLSLCPLFRTVESAQSYAEKLIKQDKK